MAKTIYKKGDWDAICDRCGEKFKASELRETWDNFFVCSKDWEPRHEQDFVRGVPDDQTVPWARPEGADAGGTDISGNTITYLPPAIVTGNQTLTVGTDPIVNEWQADLTGNVTVTLDTIGVKTGDTFQIYRTGGGAFTFDIGGLKTSPASVTFTATVKYNGSTWQLDSYTPLGI